MQKVLRTLALVALMTLPWVVKAQTDCSNPYVVSSTTPFTESFDGASMPSCWTQSGTGTWSVGVGDYSASTGTHTGAGNAMITHGSTGDTTKLITPVLDLSEYTTVQLTFWYVMRSWSGDLDGLSIYYRADTSNAWTLLQAFTTEAAIWTEATLTLPSASATYQVAFEFNDSYGYGLGVDDIYIGEPPTCFPVQSLYATNILTDGMEINWVDTINTNATYTLVYTDGGTDTTEVSGISDTTYTLFGLDATTTYYVSVYPECNDGSSAAALSGSFRTDCEGGSCNITVNMTDDYSDGWDGNAINVLQGGIVMGVATIDGYVGSGTAQFSVCAGDTVTLTFTSGGMYSYPEDLGGTVVDGGGVTVFTIANMDTYADGALLAVVADPCPSCLPPTGLTATLDANGDYELSWSSDASTFLVYAGDSLYADDVTDTSYIFTGLSASSVVALGVACVCDDGDTSSIIRINVTTPCGAISALPWSTGFETDGNYAVPLCWTRIDSVELYYAATYYPAVYSDIYSAHTGSKCLALYAAYDDDTSLIVTSPIVYNPGNLHVQFYAMPQLDASASFEAGLMTDPYDASTFISLLSIQSGFLYDYTMYEFFSDSTGLTDGDSAWLAFRLVGAANPTSESIVYIDDVSLSAIPNCRMPLAGSGSIDSVTYESATFSWDGVSDNGYDLMLVYSVNNTPDTIHIYSSGTSITIDTLLANTVYDAYVATLCDMGDGMDTTEYLALGYFQTDLRCYPLTSAVCAAVTDNTAILTWTYNNAGVEPEGVVIVLTDLTDTTVAPVTVSVLAATTHTFTGLTNGHRYHAELRTLCGDSDSASSVYVNFLTHYPPCAEVSGNSTNSYIPLYSTYKNGFSESLYDASILNGADTVNALAFQVATALNRNNVVDIYMGYTALGNLSSTAYVPVSQLTHVVANYTFNTGASGWLDPIPFDTLFVTQPTGDSLNLVIAVYNHTDSWTSGLYWATHTSAVGTSCYSYTDYSLDVDNPWTVTNNTTPMAPNVQLYGSCGVAGCSAPIATVAATTGTTATVQWVATSSEDSWRVEYKLLSDTAWTLAATVSASPYTLSGLNGGSSYQVRVGAICTDTVVYSTPVSFTTACVAIMPPYSVLFTSENPCWTATNTPNSTYGYNIWSSNTLISPEIGAPLDTLAVTVNARTYTVGSTSTGLQIMACDADGSNAVNIATFDVPNDDFHDVTVYLMNYTGTQNHFVIKSANGGDVYVKAVSIDYLPACMLVSNVTLDTATENSLGLSWTANSPSNGFAVCYRAEGNTAWDTLSVTTATATITGLTASTNYEVQVVTLCPDGSTMSTAAQMFATACVPATVPYNVPAFYNMPACWSTYHTGHPNYSWDETVPNTNGYIVSYASGNSTPTNDWLITPAVVIPSTAAADEVKVVYQIAGEQDSYSTNSIARYELLVAPNGGANIADFTDTLLIDTLTGGVFSYRRISLDNYAGDTIRFAFHNTSVSYGMVGLLDFGVRSILAPLYYMTGNSTVFTGEDNGYKAVRIEGDSNSVPTFTWTSTMATAGLATMTGNGTDSITINYTAAGYDTLMLVVSNAYGNDTSRGVVHVYDCGVVSSFPYTEEFETPNPCWRMVYGDNDPTVNPMTIVSSPVHSGSGAFRFSSYSSSSDYNQYLITPELAGSNMTLSFWASRYGTSDHLWVGFSSTTGDTSAFVWDSTEVNLSTTMTQFTVSVPEGTKYIGFHYYGNFAYYVYLDDVTITGTAVACAAPAVTVTDTTETSITIAINGNASAYEVAHMAGAWEAPTAGTAVNGNTYTFTGLTDGTAYAIGVRANCGDGTYSAWTVINVTTPQHPCAMPTGLTITELTGDGGTISWTAGEQGQTDFEVNIYNTTFNDTVEVQGTTHTFSGLYAGTNYNVRVRAMCSATNASEWTAPVVLTPVVCPKPTNVVAVAQGGNINVTWDDMQVNKYRVEWYEEGFTTNGHSMIVTTNSATITENVESGQAYDIYVYAYCSETAVSEASNKVTVEITGINGVDASHISLYPNPASTKVTIDGIEGEATVTVVDMNGRTVFTASANDNLTIDLRGYAKGAYFVRIAGERTMAIRKLIVK